MYSTYVIHFKQKPEGRGRYLVRIIGQEPTGADKDFIEHRTDFILDLVDFNELKEATNLGQVISDNELREKGTPGLTSKLDLQPELDAWTPA
jgi:hypothetical protein